MPVRVLTEVAATVAPDKEPELVIRFHDLLAKPMPDGLLRTELLRGPDGQWRIQTLWRDPDALSAMRAASEPPAAPTLFRDVGADASLTIFEVEIAHSLPTPEA